jgi:MoxR-like ATPase
VTDRDTGLDAALVALSGRVRLHEGSSRSPESVVRELYDAVFGRDDDRADRSPEDGGESGGA